MPREISQQFYTPELIHVSYYDYQENIEAYAPTKEGYTFDGWYSDVDFIMLCIFG